MNKRKNAIGILSLLLLLTSCGGGNTSITHSYVSGSDSPTIEDGTRPTSDDNPFSEPGIYTDPELAIDGIRNEEYDYPNGSGRIPVYLDGKEDTYVSLYKGERAIYFLFECKDEYISTINVEDINLCTAQSDSCELYVDTYGAGGKKRTATDYEFRVTANSKIYSYLTGFVAKVFLYGTNNNQKDIDEGFNIEGYISYTVLGNDVDKNTPTSFAFARVTKTGTAGYVWHGDVDPQIPDNYKILYKDNKMYALNDCPTAGVLKGKVLDANSNPLPTVKVSASNGQSAYTNVNGEYELNIEDATSDLTIAYAKKNYSTFSKKVTLGELRTKRVIEHNQVLLSQSESTYKTTFTGQITERDGVTPIQNAKVVVNDSFGLTDGSGRYSFQGNCMGYVNEIAFESTKHRPYSTTVMFENIEVNGITAMDNVVLDESNGSIIEFGNGLVGKATARVVRNDNESFKVLLSTSCNMDIEQDPGSYFELFIDTKASAAKFQRDETDYRFDLQYANDEVLNAHNYGNKKLARDGIKTKHGRINDLYYIEADISYSYLDITSDEVFGLYFGIKHDYNWAGMYKDNGEYIPAEYPRNYYRLDSDSSIFKATSNTAYDVDRNSLTKLSTLGNYSSTQETLKYDVSVARTDEGLVLVFDNISNIEDIYSQAHSINVYLDKNYSATKEKYDNDCTHISIYPGTAVSCFRKYDKNGNEGMVFYEENIEERFSITYKKSVYVLLPYDLFGGSKDNTMGIAIGCWNDAVGSNDFVKFNNKQPDMNSPKTYIQIAPNGSVSIA